MLRRKKMTKSEGNQVTSGLNTKMIKFLLKVLHNDFNSFVRILDSFRKWFQIPQEEVPIYLKDFPFPQKAFKFLQNKSQFLYTDI